MRWKVYWKMKHAARRYIRDCATFRTWQRAYDFLVHLNTNEPHCLECRMEKL